MWIAAASLGIGLWMLVAAIVIGLAVSAGRGDAIQYVEVPDSDLDALRRLRSAA